jgi:hypothetical protein
LILGRTYAAVTRIRREYRKQAAGLSRGLD